MKPEEFNKAWLSIQMKQKLLEVRFYCLKVSWKLHRTVYGKIFGALKRCNVMAAIPKNYKHEKNGSDVAVTSNLQKWIVESLLNFVVPFSLSLPPPPLSFMLA